MDIGVFEQVGELTRALVADSGPVRVRWHRRGVKVWVGDDARHPFHWEAQVIPRHLVDGADGAAVEIGFHAEHDDVARNDAAVAALLDGGTPPAAVADGAEAGPFLGRGDDWRRISETWLDVDLDDPEIPFEVAARLADYVLAFRSQLDTHLSG